MSFGILIPSKNVNSFYREGRFSQNSTTCSKGEKLWPSDSTEYEFVGKSSRFVLTMALGPGFAKHELLDLKQFSEVTYYATED
jgi:hypothetical protein